VPKVGPIFQKPEFATFPRQERLSISNLKIFQFATSANPEQHLRRAVSMAANHITLMEYLQRGLPPLTILPHGDSRNTTNLRYSFNDINNIGNWANFDLATIRQRYNNLLTTPQLIAREHNPSPPGGINSEPALQNRVHALLQPRVRRSLRDGFNHLQNTNNLGSKTVVTYDNGSLAAMINNYKPDTAYLQPNLPSTTRPNRAPGDIKPSWKWSTAQRHHALETQRNEFKQALSQVNFYMKQHRTQYGYILTDREFIAIRRLDQNGNLQLSNPVLWHTAGNVAHPRLTVALALWYLGMLAAEEQGQFRWRLP
jgi:hypothetical protein